jgi:hypothetical protein
LARDSTKTTTKPGFEAAADAATIDREKIKNLLSRTAAGFAFMGNAEHGQKLGTPASQPGVGTEP